MARDAKRPRKINNPPKRKAERTGGAEDSARSKRWDATMVWGLVLVMDLVLFTNSGEAYLIAIAVVLGLMTIVCALRALRRSSLEVIDQAVQSMSQQIKPPHRIAKKLLEGETVVWMTNMHPIRMTRWWLAGVAVIAASGAAYWYLDEWYISPALLGIFAFFMGCRVIVWRVEWLCLTNMHLLSVKGLLNTKVVSMPLHRITDTSVQISAASRLLSWVRLIGAPYGTFCSEQQELRYVPCAEAVHQMISKMIMRGRG